MLWLEVDSDLRGKFWRVVILGMFSFQIPEHGYISFVKFIPQYIILFWVTKNSLIAYINAHHICINIFLSATCSTPLCFERFLFLSHFTYILRFVCNKFCICNHTWTCFVHNNTYAFFLLSLYWASYLHANEYLEFMETFLY